MTTATQKISFEDYLAYDDGTGTRCELVEGELCPMSLGTGRHGAISEFLNDQFRAAIKAAGLPWTSKEYANWDTVTSQRALGYVQNS